MKSTTKIAQLGLFTGIAIIFGYLESLVPVLSGTLFGIKLGLANLSVLFVLERYSIREAVLVSVIRIVVVGFLFSNAFSILYALSGALVSLTVMELLIRRTKASIFAVSMAGGVSHNIGQLILACILVENPRILYWGVVLVILGILTGFLVGFLTREVLLRVPGQPGRIASRSE